MENQVKNNLLKDLEKQEATLIYFYSNHCAPCLSLRPKVEEMITSDFQKMGLIFVDSEAHPETAAKYQVFASPTILLYFDGKETKRFSKYISVSELGQSIQRYYDMIFQD